MRAALIAVALALILALPSSTRADDPPAPAQAAAAPVAAAAPPALSKADVTELLTGALAQLGALADQQRQIEDSIAAQRGAVAVLRQQLQRLSPQQAAR